MILKNMAVPDMAIPGGPEALDARLRQAAPSMVGWNYSFVTGEVTVDFEGDPPAAEVAALEVLSQA